MFLVTLVMQRQLFPPRPQVLRLSYEIINITAVLVSPNYCYFGSGFGGQISCFGGCGAFCCILSEGIRNLCHYPRRLYGRSISYGQEKRLTFGSRCAS